MIMHIGHERSTILDVNFSAAAVVCRRKADASVASFARFARRVQQESNAIVVNAMIATGGCGNLNLICNFDSSFGAQHFLVRSCFII